MPGGRRARTRVRPKVVVGAFSYEDPVDAADPSLERIDLELMDPLDADNVHLTLAEAEALAAELQDAINWARTSVTATAARLKRHGGCPCPPGMSSSSTSCGVMVRDLLLEAGALSDVER